MEIPTLNELVEATGVPLDDGETIREYVHRVGRQAGFSERELQQVSETMEKRRFGEGSSVSEGECEAIARFHSQLSQTAYDTVQSGPEVDSDERSVDREGNWTGVESRSPNYGIGDDSSGHGMPRRERPVSPRPEQTSVSIYRASQTSVSGRVKDVVDIGSTRRVRAIFLVLLILGVAPLGVKAATYQPPVESTERTTTIDDVEGNVTFFSVQGGETGFGAGLYAIDTETKEIIWSHTEYFRKYFDVDPLNKNQILFIAQVNRSRDSFRAIRMNWRTGEVLTSFRVPHDTHDVDYLGNGTYVIADKTYDPEDGHKIYEYRPETDTIVWSYSFPEHFPPTAGDGIENDYTHLNDVDAVDNGSAYLVSPRNFDRVFLINRSTKEVVWELGEEDNENILDEQHNPVLLRTDPAVVLVADSHNNRVVEYTRTDDGWRQTWEYANWPWTGWARDADRLPNGNTLIVGSGRSRLLEVTPEKEIVWKMDISEWAQGPYDIERLRYGDEPAGPPIDQVEGTTSQTAGQGPTMFDEYYGLARWLLPTWVSKLLFVDLHFLAMVVVGWVTTELRWIRRSRGEQTA